MIAQGALRPLLFLAPATWVVACASALTPDRERASHDHARDAMAFFGSALTTRLCLDHVQSRFQAAAFIAAATGLAFARRRGAVSRGFWEWSVRAGAAAVGITVAHFITDGF